MAQQSTKLEAVRVGLASVRGSNVSVRLISWCMTSALQDFCFVASRATAERKRRMAITYKCGGISIDFITKNFVDDPNFGLLVDFTERIPDAMSAATSDFVAAIFDERPVAISAEDGAAEVHIAEATDTASRSSDHGSKGSAKIYTRRL
jgi:hypothetical protein